LAVYFPFTVKTGDGEPGRQVFSIERMHSAERRQSASMPPMRSAGRILVSIFMGAYYRSKRWSWQWASTARAARAPPARRSNRPRIQRTRRRRGAWQVAPIPVASTPACGARHEREADVAKSKDHLVWLDCEMTGLDPTHDVILEIATVVTDNALNVVAEGPVVAIHQSDKALSVMDSWCRRQHGKSGLTERVRASTMSTADAERETLRFVRKHCYVRSSPLCGNSIGQDRRFLFKYMPRLSAFLHYQSIDVSTVKQLVRRWYGKKIEPPKKAETHLALEDIRESIEELRFYRDHAFLPVTSAPAPRTSGR
jgi:oligoribonuclease